MGKYRNKSRFVRAASVSVVGGLFLAAGLAFLAPTSARAIVVLDQSQTDFVATSTLRLADPYAHLGDSPLTLPTTSHRTQVQTYTAGKNGMLDHIDANLALLMPGSFTATMNLYAGTGIAALTAAALGSANVTVTTSGVVSFDFAGDGISQTIGDEYSFVLLNDDGGALGARYADGDPYGGGAADGLHIFQDLFRRTRLRLNSQVFGSSTRDLYFETYVSQSIAVPEPGVLPVFGMALAGLALAGRRRKNQAR